MLVKLITNNSENNKIGKNLTEIRSVDGTLRHECAIINPVIDVIGLNTSEASKTNYIRIPDFDRYYFVTEVVSVRTGVWRLTCHVDVLESFKDQIKAQTAIVARQENKYNLLMDDPNWKVYQNPKITTQKFPKGFNSQSFVMAVAGG